MGIKTVVVPFDNKPDYEELPQKLKDGMQFIFAKDMNTVLETALLPLPRGNRKEDKKEIQYIESLIAGAGIEDRIRAKESSTR